ncbi:hypothetical protein V5799_018427 [Amblyomma americanum]|uniref:LolA-like domain-containing protein n=1 Tax=Amblyomma americanum TaxID=6943 RepID=A0AAQ4EZG4_AMBAM
MASGPSLCLVLLGLLQLAACQGQPRAPFLPSDFKMNVMYKSWFDDNLYAFTVAYTRRGLGLGNRLYVSRLSQGVSYTKLYDFENDILYEAKGDTRQCTTTHGIPEAEKEDPYFPVAFRSANGRKVFDTPDSLIRFDGGEKKQIQNVPGGADEWQTDVTVTVRGQVHHCQNTIVWSKNGTGTPYCDRKSENYGRCPPVPLDALVGCEGGNAIRYSFADFVEIFDSTIFEEPVGFFCEGVDRATLPTLPSVFTFSAETKTADNQDVQKSKVWVNLPSFLVAREAYYSDADTPMMRSVFDYATGMKYFITPDTGSCQASVMAKEELTIPQPDALVWGAGRDYSYQKTGERPCRSWNCAVYAGMDNSAGSPDKSQVANLYYAYENEMKGASLPVFMEVYDEAKKGDVIERREIFDFETDLRDWSPFDISICFHAHEARTLLINVQGNADFGPGRGTRDALAKAFRAQLKNAMGIAQDIRLSRVSVFPRGDNRVVVLVRLLPAASTDHLVVADPTVDEATQKLNETVIAGKLKVVLNITGAAQQPEYVATELTSRQQAPPPDSSVGYSPGSMAALGIMMLLIGIAIALGVVYFAARKYPQSSMTTILLQPRSSGSGE